MYAISESSFVDMESEKYRGDCFEMHESVRLAERRAIEGDYSEAFSFLRDAGSSARRLGAELLPSVKEKIFHMAYKSQLSKLEYIKNKAANEGVQLKYLSDE